MIELPNNLLELRELQKSNREALEFGIKSLKNGWIKNPIEYKKTLSKKAILLDAINAKIKFLRKESRLEENKE